MNIFEIFRKFAQSVAVSGILDLNSVPSGKKIKRLLEKLSALRVPGGNQVDGLPPARHMAPEKLRKRENRRKKNEKLVSAKNLLLLHADFCNISSSWSL